MLTHRLPSFSVAVDRPVDSQVQVAGRARRRKQGSGDSVRHRSYIYSVDVYNFYIVLSVTGTSRYNFLGRLPYHVKFLLFHVFFLTTNTVSSIVRLSRQFGPSSFTEPVCWLVKRKFLILLGYFYTWRQPVFHTRPWYVTFDGGYRRLTSYPLM